MDCLTIYAIFVTIVILLYLIFDLHYFLRLLFTIGYGRIFQKRVKADAQTEIHGLCTTQDLDIFFKHMNNARYLRELDFARFHFYDRTGIYEEIQKVNGHALQTATNIRYRRTIPLGHAYKITTKLITWDEKTLYIEQQFITLSDNFIRAIIWSKQNTIGLNVPDIMARLGENKDLSYRPPTPPELQDWISSMEKSSARLRKTD